MAGKQDHRQRDEHHRFLPDPEVTAAREALPDVDPPQKHHLDSDEAKKRQQLGVAAKQRRRREKQHTTRVIQVSGLPGASPTPNSLGVTSKERHAQSTRAIERAQQTVDLIFNFTEKLILTGTDIVTKIGEGREVNEAESKLIGEARQAANKLLDKLVPDIMTDGAKGGHVQINFGAPLARLMQSGQTATIEIEDTSGNAGDQLHAAPERDTDTRQPGES